MIFIPIDWGIVDQNQGGFFLGGVTFLCGMEQKSLFFGGDVVVGRRKVVSSQCFAVLEEKKHNKASIG